MTIEQIINLKEKLKSGQEWSTDDREAYDFLVALSEVICEDDEILEQLAGKE